MLFASRMDLPTSETGTDPNDSAGIGIAVEADVAVTGNVIEGAPSAGISVGWGAYMRDVSVTEVVQAYLAQIERIPTRC